VEAGPEGCELYGFIAGEGSPFSGDSTAFDALLAAACTHRPLPMPKRLPPWAGPTTPKAGDQLDGRRSRGGRLGLT